MSVKRVHVSVPEDMLRSLDKLAEKYGMDRSGAIRYCIGRTTEEEGIARESAQRGLKKVNIAR